MRLSWRPARLVGRERQTPTARSLLLEAEGWPGHLAGQHVDVRLTADDGYQAVRSYSLAAPADGERIELGVQPVEGGEVSPYLADELPVGASVEVRGPLGGWFVWRPGQEGPVLLVAGGSGVVPLMAMIREHRRGGSGTPFDLVFSVRGPDDVWFRPELRAPGSGVRVHLLYTRRVPPGAARPAGRLEAADLEPFAGPLKAGGTTYVCGPTGFVERVSGLLVGFGVEPSTVRTERFG
jgi:ferredoxin-NADP reductase